MQLGDKKYGFTLQSIKPVEELNMTAYRYTHEASGAELIWLSCSDKNRAFCVSFKTLPQDSTGVFHILEHSVLNGSRKFPLREPFVDLLKGSLQTFLNAMTFPDKTMYPVSSTNEKDFVNLMDVYMDAVLYPRIYTKEEIFMQEGWHYIPQKDDAPDAFSGVVYNEMKGSYSSPDSVLYHTLQTEMLPDTCYTYSSGGDPAAIPDLTYDQFIATHKKFYHPENSYLYLYGDMDIEEKLKFLDEEYLSSFKKQGNSFEISWQKALGEREVHEWYEVAGQEETVHNTILAKSISLCDFNQRKTLLGMRILLSALTSSNDAPLTKAIMDAKLGDDFAAWVDDGIQQPYMTFRLKKADPDSASAFTKLLHDTFRKIADEGIDKSLLEASLNRSEFNMRELDFGVAPGVALAINVMDTWLYGGDPVESLKNKHLLEKLRKGLTNGYFEELIRRHILAPEHSVTLVLEPSCTLATERLEKEKSRVSAYHGAMSENDTAAYAEKLKRFEAFQATEDTKETRDMLPHLERSDLQEKITVTPCDEKVCNGVPTRLYNLPSNGISYLKLYFDISSLPQADWKYAALLSDVLFDCPTTLHDALSYQNSIMFDMGLLDANFVQVTEFDGERKFKPYFSISASYLEEKTNRAKELIEEGLKETVFPDEHLKMLIKQIYVAKEGELIRSGHSFAVKYAGSGTNPVHAFGNETAGYGYYSFLKDICKDIDNNVASVAKKLKELLSTIVDTDLMTVSLVASPEYLKNYIASPVSLPAHGGKRECAIDIHKKTVSAGIKIPGAVAYNAVVGNYRDAGYRFEGAMNVISNLVSLDYLWTQVRMRGGAYGCSCSINENGTFAMASYRDPHVENTYNTYHALPEYLKKFDADESEMTKLVIGAFSNLDQPMRVWAEASVNDIRAFAHLNGEYRQAIRSATLHTTVEDIRAAADMIQKVLDNASVCTIGAADKVSAANKLFETIIE